MSLYKKSFGKDGEELAALYLRKKGFTILDKNFRIRNGEIDIIALDPTQKILVFVEVKSRMSTYFGTPFEAITQYKIEAMTRGAAFYKMKNPKLPDAMRFDAVSVLFGTNGKPIVEHLENISGF